MESERIITYIIPQIQIKNFEGGVTRLITKGKLSGEPIIYEINDDNTLGRKMSLLSEAVEDGDNEYLIILSDNVDGRLLIKFDIEKMCLEHTTESPDGTGTVLKEIYIIDDKTGY